MSSIQALCRIFGIRQRCHNTRDTPFSLGPNVGLPLCCCICCCCCLLLLLFTNADTEAFTAPKHLKRHAILFCVAGYVHGAGSVFGRGPVQGCPRAPGGTRLSCQRVRSRVYITLSLPLLLVLLPKPHFVVFCSTSERGIVPCLM